MAKYYHGTAVFLFIPSNLIDPNEQFTGSCPAYHQITSKDTAIGVCKEDAISKAGSNYTFERMVSDSIRETTVED